MRRPLATGVPLQQAPLIMKFHRSRDDESGESVAPSGMDIMDPCPRSYCLNMYIMSQSAEVPFQFLHEVFERG